MLISQSYRIYIMHRHFAMKKKISTAVFIRRLKVSRPTIFRDFIKLKELGAPIVYCSFSKKHHYSTDFNLNCDEFSDRLTDYVFDRYP
jgi:predicted DNA-binding transcriptional regulator YafY